MIHIRIGWDAIEIDLNEIIIFWFFSKNTARELHVISCNKLYYVKCKFKTHIFLRLSVGDPPRRVLLLLFLVLLFIVVR